MGAVMGFYLLVDSMNSFIYICSEGTYLMIHPNTIFCHSTNSHRSLGLQHPSPFYQLLDMAIGGWSGDKFYLSFCLGKVGRL